MIEFRDVSKIYKQGTKSLQHATITIDDGEFVFIMGRSGAGKSTLLSLLLKEKEPTSGEIIVNDQNLRKMPRYYIPKYRRSIGMVFQDFRLLSDRTVYENVAFAQRVIRVKGREIKENVPNVLTKVGLSSKYKSYPNQLSGGEMQRTAIARAIVNNPSILLCDEPTGNLDRKTADEIMDLLYRINDAGTTVIVVTHSHEIVEGSGKRVITLDRGVIAHDTKDDPGYFGYGGRYGTEDEYSYDDGSTYDDGNAYDGGSTYDGENAYDGGSTYDGENAYDGGNVYDGENAYDGGSAYEDAGYAYEDAGEAYEASGDSYEYADNTYEEAGEYSDEYSEAYGDAGYTYDEETEDVYDGGEYAYTDTDVPFGTDGEYADGGYGQTGTDSQQHTVSDIEEAAADIDDAVSDVQEEVSDAEDTVSEEEVTES